MWATARQRRIHYPESDGKPIGETDWHRHTILRSISLLALRFEGLATYVSGDLLMYYLEGNPKKFIVPDVFVVKGHSTHFRRTYRIWDEGRAPDVVIEITSKKTRKRDEFEKPELYQQLGIRELFLFDPLAEYLDPQLIGYRLVDGRYQQLEFDNQGALCSEELGLHLRVEDNSLEFFDAESGARLLDPSERWLRAQQLAEQAAELANVQTLRAKNAELRAEQEANRAEQEALRAEQAIRQAALAEERAAALEAELRALRTGR